MSDNDTSPADDSAEPTEVAAEDASDATTELPAASDGAAETAATPTPAPATAAASHNTWAAAPHSGSHRSGAHHWLIAIGVFLAGLGLFTIGVSTVAHRGGHRGPGDRASMHGDRDGGQMKGGFGPMGMNGGSRGGRPQRGGGYGSFGGTPPTGNPMPSIGGNTDVSPAAPTPGSPTSPAAPTSPTPAK